MTEQYDINRYFSTMIQEDLYSTERKLRFHLDMIFQDVESFAGKTVLEIGGGSGLHSFYAAYKGAAEVVCIEPEAAGSSSGVLEKFRRVNELLGAKNVRLEPTTFQKFKNNGKQFDIILLHDSINHLDEEACFNLMVDDASRAIYRDIFATMASLTRSGGLLIACDCSRHNLFATFGMRNPLTPSIEWEKHQSPRVWARFLGEAGYGSPRIRWTSFNRFGSLGQLLLGNAVAAYFLKSYFCLTMTRR
jgi:SAM-dependent methyltransferase